MKKTIKLGVYFIMLILVLSIFSVAVEAKNDKEKKGIANKQFKRMVAMNDSQAKIAEQNGCSLIKDNKKFKVYNCKKELSSGVGLYEDYEIYTTDANANDLVDAETMPSLGLTGKGITIAVIDTGYNYNHQDLASSYAGGYDIKNNDSDPFDDNGHGSHVAGIITSDGINQNATGIAPDTKIVAIKVVDQYGAGDLTDAAEGIYYAVDNFDIDIISISLGSSAQDGYCDELAPYFYDAVEYAHQHDIPVIVAAGNTINKVTIPGCLSNVLTVGKTNQELQVATQHYNPIIDIYAPGISIYSTYNENGYVSLTGTSMSTPMVSGSIAILKQKNPDLTYDELEQILIDNARPYPIASFLNLSVLDVLSAEEATPEPFVCTKPTLQYSFVNGQFIVSWQSESGCSYNLKETTDLTSGNWLSIGIFEGNGNTLSHSLYPDGPMRFFKIELV